MGNSLFYASCCAPEPKADSMCNSTACEEKEQEREAGVGGSSEMEWGGSLFDLIRKCRSFLWSNGDLTWGLGLSRLTLGRNFEE